MHLETEFSCQCSKFTFSKSRLLATFNCKMVAIKKKNSVTKKETVKGRTLHDILQVFKKREDTSMQSTRTANAPNDTFSTLYFSTVSSVADLGEGPGVSVKIW